MKLYFKIFFTIIAVLFWITLAVNINNDFIRDWCIIIAGISTLFAMWIKIPNDKD